MNDDAKLFKTRLHNNNLLAPGTTFSLYRRRAKGLFLYISMDVTFVFFHDIGGRLHAMGCVYDPKERPLFIDNSKATLKCVLLHNGNRYISIPVGHSVHLKETHENMKILITEIKYFDHNWLICGDLKVLCVLLGQLSIPAFYFCGIVELKQNIGNRNNGLTEKNLHRERKHS